MLTKLESTQRPINKCLLKGIFTTCTMDVILTIFVHRVGLLFYGKGLSYLFDIWEIEKEKLETGVYWGVCAANHVIVLKNDSFPTEYFFLFRPLEVELL